MAITFPRDLPDAVLKPARCSFGFTPVGALSRSAGGAIAFQEAVGGNLWELSLTSVPLRRPDFDLVHAFWLSLRGGGKSIRGYDLHRCRPLAYPGALPATRHSGSAFDGTCTVTAVEGSTISLSNLPSTYVLSVGDYVSFPYLGGQNLVKVVEARTAAAGVISAVAIAPWLRTGGTLPATATLLKAWCEMRPKSGVWSSDRTILDPVTMEFIQTLSS